MWIALFCGGWIIGFLGVGPSQLLVPILTRILRMEEDWVMLVASSTTVVTLTFMNVAYIAMNLVEYAQIYKLLVIIPLTHLVGVIGAFKALGIVRRFAYLSSYIFAVTIAIVAILLIAT